MADQQNSDLDDLRNRIEWLDSERRKSNRKITEMEQKLTLQDRDLQGREDRIKELERQITNLNAQFSRLPRVDTQLEQFKDEIVQMIEQYDNRRLQSEKEMERLRRVEQENTARELVDIRRDLPTIGRLQKEMALRQAEEARLSNLIGIQQNQVSAVRNQLETWERSITFLEEKEKQSSRYVSEVQAELLEISKRWEPINNRLDIINSNLLRLEATVRTLGQTQDDVRESTKEWMEQIQIGEYERNQRLESWRRILDEHTESVERFSKEWITFSDQYKEAKMAVQTLSGWQKQIEQHQQEASERLRVESHRMQSRIDDYQVDLDKKWRTYTVDSDQRWSAYTRQERQVQESLQSLVGELERLQQEKDTLDRVQSAQADVIKQLPRLWLEEVEKAKANNPNRRRQPTLVPVREE